MTASAFSASPSWNVMPRRILNTHSVGDFCRMAFGHVGLNWQDYVRTDQQFSRPAEVPSLWGNASRAKVDLVWEPKVNLEELVAMMVEADLRRIGA